MDIDREREEKRERLRNMDEDLLMRWAYIPFVIAEGCWDYADSIINIAAQMRLSDVKGLSRRVRELRRQYNHRRQYDAIDGSGHEFMNFSTVEKVSRRSFSYIRDDVEKSIRRQYPEISDDEVFYHEAVYDCIFMLDILFKYMAIQEDKVCRSCGFLKIGSILPSELHELRDLIPKYIRKNVRIKGRGLFIHNIVNNLCRAVFVDDVKKLS